MPRATLRQRLRYEFDKTMSKGTPALIAWLAIASALMVLVVALIGIALGVGPEGERAGIGTLLWMGLMRTLDPGTMGGDAGSAAFLFLMFAITLGGIFIVSTLIGVITAGVEGKIEELRKGRNLVVEEGHTLILGWSNHIFTIVSELVLANENQRRACIVILADRDKVEMEDAIRDKVPDTKTTAVVCRTGNPIDIGDLDLVNPQGAKSIIVLAPESEDPDSQVIKTVLALTNGPNRRPEPYHIVAEIHDPRNMEAARLVGGDEAQIIEVGDIISRVTVQTCRQSGLSVVYQELLDYGGDEIYFQEQPELTGKSFGEALSAFEDSAIMGLHTAGGEILINPPMDHVIGKGDELIVISEDDDTIRLSGLTPTVDESAIVTVPPAAPAPERTLMLGWNRRGPAIINELDHYVAPGSELLIVADAPNAEEEIRHRCPAISNQTMRFTAGETTDRRTLDGLDAGSFNHIIVLCYSDALDPQRADARTLITLLHLRDMQGQAGTRFSIVSEMLDDRNRALAEVTKADDFIVSDKLISLMMAQVSENRHLNAVFADLFRPEGSEIYLKPAEQYVKLGVAVNFHTVLEAARRRGETAMGHRLKRHAGDAKQSYGITVNPDKSDKVTFEAGDKVIVLAED